MASPPSQSEARGHLAWNVVGPFWLGTSASTAHIFSQDGGSLVLGGKLGQAVARREFGDSILRTVASQQPLLAQFLSAAEACAETALTRDVLLRGTGFHTLFVELTAQCNERCVHCYADAAPERTEALSWPVISDVIDDAVRLGFERIQLTGGDPLIARTLLPAVERARAAGIPQIEVYTNGLALTDSLLEGLARSKVQFAFSMYSAIPSTHDAITRVEGSHARTLRAIHACVARGLDVRVGATLLAHTASDRDELRGLLEGAGVVPANIGFVMSHAVGRGDYVEGDNDLGQHGGGEAAFGAGKACVTAAGAIVPCIFARSAELGHVHRDRLYDVLTAPVKIRGPEALEHALQAAGTRLSCAECRLREVFLMQDTGTSPLIQLRRNT